MLCRELLVRHGLYRFLLPLISVRAWRDNVSWEQAQREGGGVRRQKTFGFRDYYCWRMGKPWHLQDYKFDILCIHLHILPSGWGSETKMIQDLTRQQRQLQNVVVKSPPEPHPVQARRSMSSSSGSEVAYVAAGILCSNPWPRPKEARAKQKI